MSEFDRSPVAQSSIQMELDPPPPHLRFSWRRALIAPAAFAALTLVVFGGVLFSGDAARVAAAPGTDLALQFVAWRDFGFTQLSRGNLPLWNPHIFGGTPYFAGFQSALLYPPNWLHLVLPLGRAINWITALQVFLAGYFMYLWCRHRRGASIDGLSIEGSIIAGIIFMFCGPYFLHVYAGHLPHVAIIVWIPLILLAIDRLIESPSLNWMLLGAAALSMQILAGHPQYVYYTGIVASIYFALRLLQSDRRRRAVAGFVAMYIATVLIAAVQLLPGFDLTRETVRSGGLPYEVASTFSLPPENLATMLVPNLFGSMPPGSPTDPTQNYFGRCYLWEVSVFIGIGGLVLAIVGAIGTKSSQRRFALAMLIVCLALALGRHTPLYWPMFKYLPQYGSFRGTTKFAVFAAAFMSMLAAIGFDRLAKSDRAPKWPALVAGAIAAVLAIGWMILGTQAGQGAAGWWGRMLEWIGESGTRDHELFIVQSQTYRDPSFIAATARAAATSTMFAAFAAAIVAAVLALAIRWRFVGRALVVLVAVEMVLFARQSVTTMRIDRSQPAEWQTALERAPDDARVLLIDFADHNAGMVWGLDNLWGYDPGVLKRYAELMYASQGVHPDQAGQYPPFRDRINPSVLPMLRCALVLRRTAPMVLAAPNPPLPTALLVRNYAVVSARDPILRTLVSPDFEPRSSVILEAEPNPRPVKGGSIGDVRVVARTTDSLDVTADIDTPALLVITNNYARGWRAVSLDPHPPQSSYQVVPANWTQQAIALTAGKHRLRIEYRPTSFVVGKWISLFSLLVFFFFLLAAAGGALVTIARFAYHRRRRHD